MAELRIGHLKYPTLTLFQRAMCGVQRSPRDCAVFERILDLSAPNNRGLF